MGFFEMGERVDVFVMLDDVQYIQREWVNRNKILTLNLSESQWITVPLKKSGRSTLINDKELTEDIKWKKKLGETIRHVYRQAPFFSLYFNQINELLNEQWSSLLDLNLALIRLIYSFLDMQDNLHLSSAYKIITTKDNKLADICNVLKADIYLANNGSKPYINQNIFLRRGIGFVFQDYDHPSYSQAKHTFVSHLSVIDVLFWHGKNAKEIILHGRHPDWLQNVTY